MTSVVQHMFCSCTKFSDLFSFLILSFFYSLKAKEAQTKKKEVPCILLSDTSSENVATNYFYYF